MACTIAKLVGHYVGGDLMLYEIPRGTTPELIFTLPFEANALAEVWVTLAQMGKVIINKTMAECQANGKELIVHLSQEETLKLDGNSQVNVQIRARDKGGNAYRSQIFTADPGQLLKDGVI